MAIRTAIIDVERKPRQCPVCGSEVVDIIYGTGDMTELDFTLAYRKPAMMGGDNIPRRPPIWACSCGCKRFRKVYFDGSDVPVKVKLLKNVRRAPLSLVNVESNLAGDEMMAGNHDAVKRYKAEFVTEYGEEECIYLTAVSEVDAKCLLADLLLEGRYGLKGSRYVSLNLSPAEIVRPKAPMFG
jgi:hypothetical protein